MADAWIFNGTTQSREIRASLIQQPLFVRPGEQAHITGHDDGVAQMLEHLGMFGAEEGTADNPVPAGRLVWHKTELKGVPISGTLEVDEPAKPDDPRGPSVAAPITSNRRKPTDGVEK